MVTLFNLLMEETLKSKQILLEKFLAMKSKIQNASSLV